MTNLQDEVLKLLGESTKDDLKEASFQEIINAAKNIDSSVLDKNIFEPAKSLTQDIINAEKAMKNALAALETVEKIYSENKETKGKTNKNLLVDSLRNASRMMSQVQNYTTRIRYTQSKLDKSLKVFYKTIENIHKMVNSKTSMFGRMFGFWK